MTSIWLQVNKTYFFSSSAIADEGFPNEGLQFLSPKRRPTRYARMVRGICGFLPLRSMFVHVSVVACLKWFGVQGVGMKPRSDKGIR